MGPWPHEVGWHVDGYGISGGADNVCSPSSGSFILVEDGQTLPPTLFPSTAPTEIPTIVPTECPVARTVVVHMTDSYGMFRNIMKKYTLTKCCIIFVYRRWLEW